MSATVQSDPLATSAEVRRVRLPIPETGPLPTVAPEPSRPLKGSGPFRVTFQFPDGQERTVQADHDEHLLDAGRRAGLDLPSLCEQGWDLACAVKVLSGSFDQSDARRYYAEDCAARF